MEVEHSLVSLPRGLTASRDVLNLLLENWSVSAVFTDFWFNILHSAIGQLRSSISAIFEGSHSSFISLMDYYRYIMKQDY